MSKEERFEREHDWIIDNNKRNTEESLIVYDTECNTLDDLCTLLNQQDQEIQELKKQLENAIIPKFKIGDYLYSVEKSGSQLLLAEGYVTTITQLDDGSIWYHLTAKPHEFGVKEESCYRTMAEVHKVTQKLLKEINNDKNNRKS